MKLAQRVVREESGMAMALAVIMIALFSVMGAGLLIFATTDLGIVVESNQGQRAFEMADAGVAAAKQQIMDVSSSEAYDGDADSESQWSESEGGVTLENLSSTNDAVTVTIKSATSSGGGGGADAGDIDSSYDCGGGYTADPSANADPFVNSFFGGKTTYTVISTGEYGDARRRVEAVFEMGSSGSGYSGFPMSVFTTGKVEIDTSAQIRCMSLFSTSYLEKEITSSSLAGPDIYFGNWYNPPWNSFPRPLSIDAGVGVLGKIKYSNSTVGTARVTTKKLDYSRVKPENGPFSNPLMANNCWAQPTPPCTGGPTTQITTEGDPDARISFPFDPRPDSQVTPAQLADLEAEARAQDVGVYANGHYKNFGGNDAFLGGNLPEEWLDEAGDVAYVEFEEDSGKFVDYPDSCDDFTDDPDFHPCPQGTLVIENGMFQPSGGNAGHEGMIIIRGTSDYDKQWFKTGNSDFQMKGFINVEGNLTLQTGARIYPIPPDQLSDYFLFSSGVSGGGGGGGATSLTPRSWREVYSAD